MNADYLNPVLDSYRHIMETAVQTVPEKGEIEKIDTLNIEKEYAVLIKFESGLEGIFVWEFDKESGIAIVDKMTGGMGNKEEIDEMGESCINEIGNMIKGGAIDNLEQEDYKATISEVKFVKKEELPSYDEVMVKIPVNSEIGETNIYISLNK